MDAKIQRYIGAATDCGCASVCVTCCVCVLLCVCLAVCVNNGKRSAAAAKHQLAKSKRH